jgi:osmotically-inducible protein OsmY
MSIDIHASSPTPRPARSLARARSGLVLALVVLAATVGLSACVPVVVGGAMVGGALAATDRRTTGTQLEDQSIELKALSRSRELLGDRGQVSHTSYNRIVLLSGEVPTDADKAAVEQAVGRIENVRGVVNELAVMGPSSLGSRANDRLLSTKVKATFVDAKDVFANAFKVTAERGVIYLMGRVTEREANTAVELARSVSGVVRVVKVFEYITEAELVTLQPQVAPAR